MADERYTKLYNIPNGVDGFKYINGQVDSNDVNLQDAMNLLMKMAKSPNYCIVGGNEEPANQYCLWVDTREDTTEATETSE